MKKIIVTVLVVLMALAAFAACAQQAQPSAAPSSAAPASSAPASSAPASSEAASSAPAASSAAASESASASLPSGKLAVVGSTSVGPLMEKIAAKYNETNPNLSIEIQQVGSTAGVTATVDGSADIGMSSRELSADELAQGLKPVEIALDGIAVIVHKDNKVAGLTSQQITDIFLGKITNWKDVGGDDKAITVIQREEGSGTRTAFEELMALQTEVEKDGKKTKVSAVTDKALVQEGTGAVKAGVAGNPNAIGYISLGVADDTIKILTVDGITASVATVKDKTYKIQRPFLVLTKGDPKDLAKTFIDYMLSDEAQTLVDAENYIRIDK